MAVLFSYHSFFLRSSTWSWFFFLQIFLNYHEFNFTVDHLCDHLNQITTFDDFVDNIDGALELYPHQCLSNRHHRHLAFGLRNELASFLISNGINWRNSRCLDKKMFISWHHTLSHVILLLNSSFILLFMFLIYVLKIIYNPINFIH